MSIYWYVHIINHAISQVFLQCRISTYMRTSVSEAGISGRENYLHSTVFCGMQLLIPAWDTCFCMAPKCSYTRNAIFMAWFQRHIIQVSATRAYFSVHIYCGMNDGDDCSCNYFIYIQYVSLYRTIHRSRKMHLEEMRICPSGLKNTNDILNLRHSFHFE